VLGEVSPVKRCSAALLLAFCVSGASNADAIFSAPSADVKAGSRFDVRLTFTNSTDAPMRLELSSPLHATLDAGTAVTTLELTSDELGSASHTIAPGAFQTILLHGEMPDGASGPVTLTLTGIHANAVVLQVAPKPETPPPAQASEKQAAPELTPKPPALALSVYEPVYFIAGGDGGLNAKFQISFKYRLFDNQGRLARRLPWIDDLYFSYSQTSLWDLHDLSKPFRDTSYRPRLFYGNYDLTNAGDGLWHFGFEGGLGHESNGRDGADSRSINIIYMRPTVTFGDVNGKHFFLAPLIYDYLDKSENPDIQRYRGYVDWLIGYGSKGGWNVWTTLRKGTAHYGSAEVNVSYPLSRLSEGELSGWLLLQFFDGYGENLLDYNRKGPVQWRLGLAIAL
jgi:outer membrane phospholipase A